MGKDYFLGYLKGIRKLNSKLGTKFTCNYRLFCRKTYLKISLFITLMFAFTQNRRL